MFVLIPLFVLTVLVISFVLLSGINDIVQDQVTRQAVIFQTQKTAELEEWATQKQTNLAAIVSDADISTAIDTLTSTSSSSDQFTAARSMLLQEFGGLKGTNDNLLFEDFFILNTSGRIVAASDEEWEGLNLEDELYYHLNLTEPEPNSFVLRSPAPFENVRLALMTSEPVFDSAGNYMGTLVGMSDYQSVLTVINKNREIFSSSIIYFILGENQLVGFREDSDTLSALAPTEDHTEIIIPAISAKQTGAAVIESFEGDTSVSAYTWLPLYQAGFVIEIPDYAYNLPIYSLIAIAGGVLAAALLLILLAINLLMQNTTKPILDLAKASQLISDGKWSVRPQIERADEIGFLAERFNAMLDTVSGNVNTLESQIQERTREIVAAAEVAQMVSSARDLDDLLHHTVELISERFRGYHTAIFLLDDTKENAIVREASGSAGRNLKAQGFSVPVNESSIIGWTAKNKTIRVAANVKEDPTYMAHELLPDTLSEIGLPIYTNSEVYGVLDIQSWEEDAFSPEIIDVLRTLANQLATAIQNFRLLEGTAIDLQEVSILYRGSHQIAQAQTRNAVFESATITIQQTSFMSAIYTSDGGSFQLVTSETSPPVYVSSLPRTLHISDVQVMQYLQPNIPTIIRDVNQPVTAIHNELLEVPRRIECQSAAFLPIMENDHLSAIMVLSSQEWGTLSQTALQPYSSLVALITTALVKVTTLTSTQQRLIDLETATDLSRTVAYETDMTKLYKAFHEEIAKAVGEVDFYIALYHEETKHLEFPYVIDEGDPITLDPIALGEGLTSVIIRTEKPLLLTENAETRARSMGGKVAGHWAKSWLGVPLVVEGEIIGALVIQDVNTEQRFSQEDVRLVSTLSNQMAATIRSTRQLEAAHQRATNLQTVADMVRKLSLPLTRRDQLLQKTAELLEEHYQFTHFGIFMFNETGDKLDLQAGTGEAGESMLAEGYSVTVGAPSNIGQSAEKLEVSAINDVTLRPNYRFNPLLPDTKSDLCVPIFFGEDALGIINIQHNQRFAFTTSVIETIQALVEELVVLLANADRFTENEEQLSQYHLVQRLDKAINDASEAEKLYPIIHHEINELVGEVDFYIAIYDEKTEHIEFPYVYDDGELAQIEAIPLGDGLTSVVIQRRRPVMLVEDAQVRAQSMGAKVSGNWAKSWMGVPLISGGSVVGVMTLQDLHQEYRFTKAHLEIVTTIADVLAKVVQNNQLLNESERRAVQLQTAAEIARETSATMEHGRLLERAVNLIRDRFDFYHASVFLLDNEERFAVIRESTGEAGRQMLLNGHRLEIGSQSIMGYVTANRKPLVVNDVEKQTYHRFNPLLPDTKSELGIPLIAGDRLLGALDVQSTERFAFSPDDIEVLQILADQLAVALANAELFAETQEHLAQHRLIHHVTTVAASSSSMEDALSSAVQGLRVTLGDRVSILMLDAEDNILRVTSAAGYEENVLGMSFEVGSGIAGWVAERREPLTVNNVLQDPRYISGDPNVRSELAVPLIYRGELVGVLNVESDQLNDFDQHDQDILGTLAGSLAAIIVNARLTERQRILLDVTDKIRRSVSMQTILETTANELRKTLKTRRASIQVNLEPVGGTGADTENGKEGVV
ncbi:MAG: GAF domain-containing protein [Anaerolineales bacterium]|nr:GAF domain-containing protein [Anaerolineales bacterium]